MTRNPELEGLLVPPCTPLCRASPQSNLCWRQKEKEDVKRGKVLGRQWSVRMSSRRHGQKESLTGRPRGGHREGPAHQLTEAWSYWIPGVFLPQTTTHSSGFHVHLHPQADTRFLNHRHCKDPKAPHLLVYRRHRPPWCMMLSRRYLSFRNEIFFSGASFCSSSWTPPWWHCCCHCPRLHCDHSRRNFWLLLPRYSSCGASSSHSHALCLASLSLPVPISVPVLLFVFVFVFVSCHDSPRAFFCPLTAGPPWKVDSKPGLQSSEFLTQFQGKSNHSNNPNVSKMLGEKKRVELVFL